MSNMERKYKKFKKFNWAYSNDWQNYYRNLYPPPPISKLLHYKKKFYRNYIDPDFDITYIPPEGEAQETAYTPPPEVIEKNLKKLRREKARQNGELNDDFEEEKSPLEKLIEKYELSKKNSKPLNSSIFKYSQLLFLLLFILSIPIGIKTNQFAMYGFIIKVFREVGKPYLSKKYFQCLFLNDSFHTLIYILLCVFDNFNYYMILPVTISSIVAISEDLKNSKLIFNYINNYISSVNKVKEKLIQDKTNLEVIIGFLLIIGTSIGINTFKTPIIYWHVLRFRYIVNPYVNKSFAELNQMIENFKESNKCHGFLKYIIEKLQRMFAYLGSIGDDKKNKKKKEKEKEKEDNDGNEKSEEKEEKEEDSKTGE